MPHPSRIAVRCLLAATIGAATVYAQANAPWTTVGSAGTVDEQDLFNVNFGSPVAGAVSVWGGIARIRYNVVAVEGVLQPNGFNNNSYFMGVEIAKTFARPIDAITAFGPRPALA